MKFYMAPMEGMTGYVFRNAYQKYYHDVDRYFTPFLCSVGLSHRELQDVLPEHNRDMDVVPQILTNRAEDFLKIARRMEQFGYERVNLNLGCSSGTVVSKGRGAGFLGMLPELENFLEKIFDQCPLRISIKTRIGVQDPGEWTRLQELYNRFPLDELIVHPRLQKDFYQKPVHLEVFAAVAEQSTARVCYNGEIHSLHDFERFHARFPQVDTVMLGRGIFKRPGLAGACSMFLQDEAAAENEQSRETFEILQDFLAELLCGYRREMGNEKHTLYKMKEVWTYLGQSIPDGARQVRQITKAKTIAEYKIAAREALRSWEEKCCLYN
ncbi:MAG: tRNA-dihydrouridine synthase family protein [Lachnospiraceae bacterium]|nr:tRNA-dihydrouridine synthase family protein [Lachnospiraceae bacterium]MBR1854234.1 tRNA-dihydrouridine synthase family protein [Lachnospiraceae bacterium]